MELWTVSAPETYKQKILTAVRRFVYPAFCSDRTYLLADCSSPSGMAAVAKLPIPIPTRAGGTKDIASIGMEHPKPNGGESEQSKGHDSAGPALEAVVNANNNIKQPTLQHAQLGPDDFKVVRTLGTGESWQRLTRAKSTICSC